MLAGVLMPISVYSQESQETNSINLVDIPVLLAAHCLFNYSLGLAHQYGPFFTAKLFILCGAEEAKKAKAVNLKPTGSIFVYPEFKNNFLNAIMYGSAPIAGLAACFFTLKCVNILHEYDKTGQWKQAIFNGLRKSTFNLDQSVAVTGWVHAHIALNAFDCIPRFYRMNDGSLGGNTGAKVKYEVEQYLGKILLQTGKI